MSTCREIVNGALRKIGRLAGGREARPSEQTDGLTALQGLYRKLIAQGAFGRLRDIIIEDGDYVAGENERITHIVHDSEAGHTVSLAATIDDCDGEKRPPRDCSIVTVSDQVSGDIVEFIYDSAQASWQAISDLALTSMAPLSHRDPNGLMAMLAMEIADEYGADVRDLTQRSAALFQSSLINQYGSRGGTIQTEYF